MKVIVNIYNTQKCKDKIKTGKWVRQWGRITLQQTLENIFWKMSWNGVKLKVNINGI